jgi:hypothetical protein
LAEFRTDWESGFRQVEIGPPKKQKNLEISCWKSLKVHCRVYENIPFMTVFENEKFCTTFVIINLGLDPDPVLLNTDPKQWNFLISLYIHNSCLSSALTFLVIDSRGGGGGNYV